MPRGAVNKSTPARGSARPVFAGAICTICSDRLNYLHRVRVLRCNPAVLSGHGLGIICKIGGGLFAGIYFRALCNVVRVLVRGAAWVGGMGGLFWQLVVQLGLYCFSCALLHCGTYAYFGKVVTSGCAGGPERPQVSDGPVLASPR